MSGVHRWEKLPLMFFFTPVTAPAGRESLDETLSCPRVSMNIACICLLVGGSWRRDWLMLTSDLDTCIYYNEQISWHSSLY